MLSGLWLASGTGGLWGEIRFPRTVSHLLLRHQSSLPTPVACFKPSADSRAVLWAASLAPALHREAGPRVSTGRAKRDPVLKRFLTLGWARFSSSQVTVHVTL